MKRRGRVGRSSRSALWARLETSLFEQFALGFFSGVPIMPFLILVGSPSFFFWPGGLFLTEGLFPSNLLSSSFVKISQVFNRGPIDTLIEFPIFAESSGDRGQDTFVRGILDVAYLVFEPSDIVLQ